MNRIWGHVVMFLGVCAVGSAAIPACATNDQSIFVRGVLAPSTNRQNNTCVYTDDPSQPQLFSGRLDVGVRDNYQAVLLVGNQLIGRGDPDTLRAESNRVHIEGAIVTVTNPDGSVISEFTAPGAGVADPQSNNAPDYGVFAVTLIDAPTVATLKASLPDCVKVVRTVIAKVKAVGTTLGGHQLESGEFAFPISVCNGCLVDFSSGNDPAVDPQPNCAKPFDSSAATTLPCVVGQDEAVPCQLCRSSPACNPQTCP